jgi:hypothetical protein
MHKQKLQILILFSFGLRIQILMLDTLKFRMQQPGLRFEFWRGIQH